MHKSTIKQPGFTNTMGDNQILQVFPVNRQQNKHTPENKLVMIKKILLFLVSAILIQSMYSQDYKTLPKDSIITKALRDELYRNLNQLENPETGKPFFIAYSYLEGEVTEASGFLGALMSSNNYPLSDWNLRLMMGDYNLNDENFEDRYSQEGDAQELRINPPAEPDYWAIRKMFWWNTSNVFRSAAKNYKNKLAALKDKPIQSEDEKIPDYQKATPIKIFRENKTPLVTKEFAENYVRKLSSVFKDFKDLHNSDVTFKSINAKVYIINTEGTEMCLPINIVYVYISASIYDDKGDELSESATLFGKQFNELPAIDTLKKVAEKITGYLSELKNSENITENYNGPIIFYNDAAANILATGLFTGSNPLKAYRKPLVNDLSKEMTPKDNNSIESKIERKVISKDLSVTALPHLKDFNGLDLVGAFDVDGEGIIPPDEINLVEKGILKNLLSGRVPSKKCPLSNGHNRIGFSGGRYYNTINPGVIKVTNDNSKTDEELREQLYEIAEDNGLDYVFIVRPLFSLNNCNGPMVYYKLDVNTKTEKIVRPLSLDDVSLSTLNKITGAGNKIFIKNMLFDNNSFDDTYTSGGVFASFIVPNAILIKEIDLEAHPYYGNTDVPIFPNATSELK